jgi:exo-beta-1,3-glucanase (GH17 family)
MPLAVALLVAGLIATAAFWWLLGRAQVVPGGLAAGERLQCASYTPFRAGETPLAFRVDTARLAEDFALLAPHVGCLRLYSVRGMEQVPAVARQHGLTLIVGAWIGPDAADNEREVAGLVRLANAYPDVIQAVLVGNEVLLRREQTAAQLSAYLRRVQSAVSQPVSYGDVWEFWLRNPALAADVDFVTIHLLPYWEDEPAGIAVAIDAVAHAHARVAAAFPARDILIGETGWPSAGRQRQLAVPSRVNQARFIRGFLARARAEGWRYNVIEAFDQPWKRAQEGAVGGYWGLFDTHRQDKGVLQGGVSNLPGWRGSLALALALGFVLLLASRTWRSPGAIVLAVLAGNALAVHGQQLLLFSRDWPETAWFGLLGLASVASCWLGCRRAAGHARAPWHDGVLGWSAALAAIVMLGLAFDPRYRYFPVAPFLVPAVVAFWYAPGDGPWAERNRALGALLVLCLPVVLWQETLVNLQALAWCAVMGLLAAGLLRSRAQVKPQGQSEGQSDGESGGPYQGKARFAGRNVPASASASKASTAAGAP